MRWGVLMVLVLIGLNAGALFDALAYPSLVARARGLLPMDWRESAGMEADQRLAHLRAGQSPEQIDAADAQGAMLQIEGGRVVLALPVGLDSDVLDLETGCFRFVRRRLTFIVWHYYISTGCL